MRVLPTRQELLLLGSRLQKMRQGKHMLTQKRDKLLSRERQLQTARQAAREKLMSGYQQLTLGYLQLVVTTDAEYLQSFAANILRRVSVQRGEEPLDWQVSFAGVNSPYPMLLLDHHYDNLAAAADDWLQLLVEVIAREHELRQLELSLRQTNRRVNSLEYNLIPELEQVEVKIKSKLDERELQARTNTIRQTSSRGG